MNVKVKKVSLLFVLYMYIYILLYTCHARLSVPILYCYVIGVVPFVWIVCCSTVVRSVSARERFSIVYLLIYLFICWKVPLFQDDNLTHMYCLNSCNKTSNYSVFVYMNDEFRPVLCSFKVLSTYTRSCARIHAHTRTHILCRVIT